MFLDPINWLLFNTTKPKQTKLIDNESKFYHMTDEELIEYLDSNQPKNKGE